MRGAGHRPAPRTLRPKEATMTLYIVRRLVWTIIVVAAVIAITFVVFYLLPAGDPALRFAGKNPNQAELDVIRHRLGLDQAWYIQFLKFIKNFFTGDRYGWPGLGYTFAGQASVLQLILARAPRTLFLIAGAAVLWLSSGVAIGVISAVKRRSVVDRAA